MKRIILASESPRRREILMQTDIAFMTATMNYDETLDTTIPIHEAVEKIALTKATSIQDKYPSDVIVGADTVVIVDGEVLGKPKDEQEAFHMLKKLSGRTHQVMSAVAILKEGRKDIFHVVTDVTFIELSDDVIKKYIKTKEPYDKAGAYAIQGKAAVFIDSIHGDYYNVVGLPISRLVQKLKNFIDFE